MYTDTGVSRKWDGARSRLPGGGLYAGWMEATGSSAAVIYPTGHVHFLYRSMRQLPHGDWGGGGREGGKTARRRWRRLLLLWGSGERCQAAGLACSPVAGGRFPRSRCEQLPAPASRGGGDGGSRERGRDLAKLNHVTAQNNAGAVARMAPGAGGQRFGCGRCAGTAALPCPLTPPVVGGGARRRDEAPNLALPGKGCWGVTGLEKELAKGEFRLQ